uniref:Uncharacterized protein n=1 Tax=Quercus lobata TaxID=97700 RepID=A0A7N2MMS1_QUELO
MFSRYCCVSTQCEKKEKLTFTRDVKNIYGVVITAKHREDRPFNFAKLEEQPPPLVEQPPPLVEQPPPLVEQPPPPKTMKLKAIPQPPPPSPTRHQGPNP